MENSGVCRHAMRQLPSKNQTAPNVIGRIPYGLDLVADQYRIDWRDKEIVVKSLFVA